MDSDLPSRAGFAAVILDRHLMRIVHLSVAVAIDVVRVVQPDEPAPSAARMFSDDRVNALRGAPIALVLLGAALVISSEDGVIGLVQPPLVIDHQLMARLPGG